MASVPKANAAQLPASKDFTHDSGSAQERLSRPKRQIVHSIDSNVVANVENAGPFIALQAVNIFGTVRLAAAHRAVVDGMRPGVTGLKFQALAKATLQRQTECVVSARPDITLVIDRAKGIAAWIVLVQRSHAVAVDRVEGDRFGAEVHCPTR